MLVKVAPIGERVIEVNVETGTKIEEILRIANVLQNERTILLNNHSADVDTEVTSEGSVVALANKMKGGK